ncbi:helix-turn-helix protein [Herbihabitans rhizosphaerae]|uniref:Helix-turn-helix protein n=1 Tax=Herbihabitans rhizosphaerae TaxID=1872711 RepID=A0A4Q7KJM2_9PSEU|nr:helix-turn-helix transcriptional regulator [Herbihabitans rhizosphaerae]RZS34824.1 helix-turn-helix protein [Herbihabitans rhizosphaerae]
MGDREYTARARELGQKLRALREKAGLPAYDLADRLGWSASKVSRIESGDRNLAEAQVVRYAAYCGATPNDMDILQLLCREARNPGYWLTQRLRSLLYYESTAITSSSWDSLVVPGILQTQEYATALSTGAGVSPGLTHHYVGIRMERQRQLNHGGFTFYVHEQALRLRVGGNRVMNEQLLKLVLLTDQAGISIRVVPADLGERSHFGPTFIRWEYERHRPLVSVDIEPGLFLEEKPFVATYQAKLDRIKEVALTVGQSREVLAALASEFDRPEDPRDAPDRMAEEQLQRT